MLVKFSIFLAVLVCAVSSVMAQEQPLAIENKWLRVNVDAKAGTFTITDKISNRVFVSHGKWAGGGGFDAKMTELDIPEVGRLRTVMFQRSNSESELISLVDDQPFAWLQTLLFNSSDKEIVLNKVKTASF